MSTCRPLFSIIIPIFKTPLNYVRQAFESVQAQSLVHECEMVVWDDGSPASYKRDLYRLLNSLSGVSIVFGEHTSNLGLCHSRNAAISHAAGEWLLLLDSDDYIDKLMLESIKPSLKSEVELVYTDHIFISADGANIIHKRQKAVYQHLHSKFKGSLYDPMLHATFVFHCQIFRRATFYQIGGFRTDLRSGEEVDLHLRLSELSPSVNYNHVPSYLYTYRDNPESVCHDADYYSNLISNIEQILVETTQRRGYQISEARRIGRASNTYAAHYILKNPSVQHIYSPWFDYETNAIYPEYFTGSS